MSGARALKKKRPSPAKKKKTAARRTTASTATRKTASSKKQPPRYWTRGSSGIHRHGLFAACDIPRGAKVIEYVGTRLTKAEGWKRATDWLEKAKGTNHGAVYVFELNARWDIDGNVPWNPARLINHSCKPNCEPHVKRGHIWITAKRRITAGEELTYDYGYDLDHWEEHPCRCGSENCIGYIVATEHRAKLKRILARRTATKTGKDPAPVKKAQRSRKRATSQ